MAADGEEGNEADGKDLVGATFELWRKTGRSGGTTLLLYTPLGVMGA